MFARNAELSSKFCRDGFIVEKSSVSPKKLDLWRDILGRYFNGQNAELNESPHFGFVLPFREVFESHRIITEAAHLTLLRKVGCVKPHWIAGYFIRKPPKSDALYWHQDWWGWANPASYAHSCPVYYLMYYLQDTNMESGSLRVIPRSHRQFHYIHGIIGEDDTYLQQPAPQNSPRVAYCQEELTLSVEFGDVIARDCRLLHATHSNLGVSHRDLVILKFCDADSLSQDIAASINIKKMKPHKGWDNRIISAFPTPIFTYSGESKPTKLCRKPNFNEI